MNRNKTFIILINLCFLLSGMIFAHQQHEEGKAKFKADETFSSKFGIDRRCIIKKRPPEHIKSNRPLKKAADCSMSKTIIQNEYWPSTTCTIPVVFHIIYKSDGTGNISDQQIKSQVNVLNQDYGAVAGSAGEQGYNTKIQFKLAGITRTANNSWFNDQDERGFKQALGWDQNRYLNVYVNSAGGYLGYAYLPQEDAGDVYDGVVVLYEAVGGRNNGFDIYDQGRTLVHEVGHYLGLLHTFEGYGCFEGYTSGDLIADTHSENNEHYDCKQTSTCGTPDDIHNYMNYTNDSCMYEFTPEQANRMVCSLVNYRPQLYQTGSVTQPTITVSSPNGGEKWTAGSSYTIKWTSTGTVGNVKIEYTANNGSSWVTVTSSTANDGAYTWKVPDISSSQCKVRIKEASDSNPTDTSNAVFTITKSTSQPGITVTFPNGGEELIVGSTYTIKWTSTGTVGNVKIEYTANNGSSWATISSSTTNDGAYSWKVPNISSSKCKVRIKEASDSNPLDTSNAVFTISKSTSSEPAKISLNRTTLNFSATNSGTVTDTQRLWLNNSGGETLNWSVNVDQWWLKCTPTSGADSNVLMVSVTPAGLYPGNYQGIVTLTAPDAANSPQTITVNLNVIHNSQDKAPFGNLSTPLDNSTVRSSIPVTGWVLDDIGVKSVEIYRQGINSPVYIGEALLVEGARPDVEAAYPDYPMNHMAGWGYMLLTNFLPEGYNVIYAIAADSTGKRINLGSSTILVDNSHAVKPFGAIDTPSPGGKASGTSFRNQGWTLTPLPNKISQDGSTISVYVDGKFLGHPQYNIYRNDIATLFPGYKNSNGALAYLEFNTTSYSNGVHSIQWVVIDNAGNTDGVGSRYFTVQNIGNRQPATISSKTDTEESYLSPPVSSERSKFLLVKKGYQANIKSQHYEPDSNGNITIEVCELERMEVHFANDSKPLRSIKNTTPLPVGSTLDMEKGIFYWQAGLGYLGHFHLEFVVEDAEGCIFNYSLNVNITPR